jgi:type I site-specific restriction endonuclease
MTFNESRTRALHIDPQLRAADWKLNDRTQVRLEVPVDGYDAEPWNGVTDYCLYDASGNVLAVVEAKAAARSLDVFSTTAGQGQLQGQSRRPRGGQPPT